MLRTAGRHRSRRVALSFEGLEGRYAPAAFNMMGFAAVEMAAPATVAVVPAPRVEAAVEIAPARTEDLSIGFLHPFAQNGFYSSEYDPERAPMPRPDPVTPPALPVGAMPQLPTQDVVQPVEETPAIRPAGLTAPAALPSLDAIDAVFAEDARSTTAWSAPEQSVFEEPQSDLSFNLDDTATVPSEARPIHAMYTGFLAVGFLTASHSPRRRKEDFIVS